MKMEPFQYATTRGDGIEGEIITENVKTIKGIPNRIPFTKPIEVRGEVYLSKSDFLRINEERQLAGERLFANPRNAAAGTIKLQSTEIVRNRNLKALIYSIGYTEEQTFSTEQGLLQFLEDQGFSITKNYKLATSTEMINEYCEYWEKHRDELEFEIDGIVAKINNIGFQDELGFTQKRPQVGNSIQI